MENVTLLLIFKKIFTFSLIIANKTSKVIENYGEFSAQIFWDKTEFCILILLYYFYSIRIQSNNKRNPNKIAEVQFHKVIPWNMFCVLTGS